MSCWLPHSRAGAGSGMGETRASADLAGGWLDAKYLAAAVVSACSTCEEEVGWGEKKDRGRGRARTGPGARGKGGRRGSGDSAAGEVDHGVDPITLARAGETKSVNRCENMMTNE